MLDLASQHLKHLQALLYQYVPGVTVWAFGSRVNGNAKSHSDLDIVLKACQPIPQQQLFRFVDALEESDLPIKVDVLDWQQISPEFQQQILSKYWVLPKRVVAHVAGEREQSVREHLQQVAELAASFAGKINSYNVGKLIGLLHDFGKYSYAFQCYIQSATELINPDEDDYVDAKGLKGKIDHSTAGAQLVWQLLKKFGSVGQGELCGQILALCIASHHSGLIDILSVDEREVFANRMNKPDGEVHLQECLQTAEQDILEQIKQLADQNLVKELFGNLRSFVNFNVLSTIDYFNLGFFTRFLFSCLIDADRLNSAEFEDPARLAERLKHSGPVPWQIAIDRVEQHLAGLDVRNYVDELRREISDNCKNNAYKPQGIYTLTVPTGGGKTYASLRYALHHAQHHGLERIIYVIPYTSIIDQNARVIREVLEREQDVRPWVLEHHSNLEPEQQTWQSKLVSENWDAPVVLTTMVQLLETLFSGGTRSVRRLHQLANSILIFDEIQTLPVNCVHLFCNAMNFLVSRCNSTVVLCTATQPLLNQLKSPDKGQLVIPDGNELAGDFEQHFTLLNRVEILNRVRPGGWNAQDITELAITQFQQTGSCLVIVNTKAWAQELYQRCSGQVDNKQLFHLSTNQCPAHRKSLLAEIRERLESGLPVLCISTQLIEAGVDVDFFCVIRFLAGLDSIAQAAGRCNRNGKLQDTQGNPVKGQVFIVNPDKESTDLLPDIEIGKAKAERVLTEGFQDMLAPAAMKQYFRYYFFDRADTMVYPLPKSTKHRDDSLLNLLTSREVGSAKMNANFAGREGKIPLLRQAFMEAGRQFKAIDAPTQAVIVQYGAGRQLVAELCAVAKDFDAHRYYQLLRKAQQFSVNVFPNTWAKLLEQNAVYEIQQGHGIYYLDKRYYSGDFGLSTEPTEIAASIY